jgi:hypothetical protein
MSVDTVWSLALIGFGFGIGAVVGFIAAMNYKA